jgi:NADH-quinone oxidoreductase subunit A
MTTPTSIVAYLALFAGIGFAFLFVNLLVGKLLRPHDPHPEKLEVYECGEPTIGSSFVQFDLRFYVVALLFIIFDVEVAFFFPWANVFGKATHLSDPRLPLVAEAPTAPGGLSPEARGLFRELGIENPAVPEAGVDAIRESAHRLAWLSIWDIAVFFAVLMVGFAYVWKRGDLDWVRAVSHERSIQTVLPPPRPPEREPAMMA